jgi:hypothetical protein
LFLQLLLEVRWRRRDFARLSEIRREISEAFAKYAGSMSRITALLPRTPTRWMWAARRASNSARVIEPRGEFDESGA